MATVPPQADVRAWARDQGLKVGDRGRLPAQLMAQYEAAHPQGAGKATPTNRQAQQQKRTQPAAKAQKRAAAAETESAAAPTLSRARRVVPAVAAEPAPEPTPVVATDGVEALREELFDELEVVRGEVAQLRKHLDEVLGRVAELEQPRGMFNRTRAKR